MNPNPNPPKPTDWHKLAPEERERRPLGAWKRVELLNTPALEAHPHASAWRKDRVCVISSLSNMELPGGGVGPTWLVSGSSCRPSGQVRANNAEVRTMLNAFEFHEADEDNHEPGVSRAFFMPIDPARRLVCECKTSETVRVEADGFRWSNAAAGPCRGCRWAAMRHELELPGRCPNHPDGPRVFALDGEGTWHVVHRFEKNETAVVVCRNHPPIVVRARVVDGPHIDELDVCTNCTAMFELRRAHLAATP